MATQYHPPVESLTMAGLYLKALSFVGDDTLRGVRIEDSDVQLINRIEYDFDHTSILVGQRLLPP